MEIITVVKRYENVGLTEDGCYTKIRYKEDGFYKEEQFAGDLTKDSDEHLISLLMGLNYE